MKGANVLAVRAAPGDGQHHAFAPIVNAGIEIRHLARDDRAPWSYTLEQPADDWFSPAFDAANWQLAPGGFGTLGGARTPWKTGDIWLRREFKIGQSQLARPTLRVFHDEDAEIYINGVLAAKLNGFTGDYVDVPMSPAGAAALKSGANLIAVHCHQTGGGQFIDVGIVEAQ